MVVLERLALDEGYEVKVTPVIRCNGKTYEGVSSVANFTRSRCVSKNCEHGT